ncbi:MAG: NFACT family protein, partial [Fibrobacter sp.]|nr:NFACT family protein [Fibrobacter sp.]
MAFDAGMLACVLHEIGERLTGGKIEKIHMPQKDMIVLIMKNGGGTHRLLINAGPSSPRLCITSEKTENPAVPPMFCMMMRKHFGGAKLLRTEQLGFERAARFTFETYDELGFKTEKHLIAEIMGKYSNLILTNAEDKIIGLLKTVDFSTSQKRQLLPGMIY